MLLFPVLLVIYLPHRPSLFLILGSVCNVAMCHVFERTEGSDGLAHPAVIEDTGAGELGLLLIYDGLKIDDLVRLKDKITIRDLRLSRWVDASALAGVQK